MSYYSTPDCPAPYSIYAIASGLCLDELAPIIAFGTVNTFVVRTSSCSQAIGVVCVNIHSKGVNVDRVAFLFKYNDVGSNMERECSVHIIRLESSYAN